MLPAILATSKVPISDDKRGSMEFHGNARVKEFGPIQIPWNSMEYVGYCTCAKFNTDPCNFNSPIVNDRRSSMKFH